MLEEGREVSIMQKKENRRKDHFLKGEGKEKKKKKGFLCNQHDTRRQTNEGKELPYLMERQFRREGGTTGLLLRGREKGPARSSQGKITLKRRESVIFTFPEERKSGEMSTLSAREKGEGGKGWNPLNPAPTADRRWGLRRGGRKRTQSPETAREKRGKRSFRKEEGGYFCLQTGATFGGRRGLSLISVVMKGKRRKGVNPNGEGKNSNIVSG